MRVSGALRGRFLRWLRAVLLVIWAAFSCWFVWLLATAVSAGEELIFAFFMVLIAVALLAGGQ